MTATRARPSTAELAASARAGDRDSFAALVVAFRPRLVAFLARRLPDACDAEDVAQETFLRAYDRLAHYDPARPFGTWLFAIGKHAAVNHAVAKRRRLAREARGAGPEAGDDAGAETVDDAAADGALWQRAREVLSAPTYRVLWLRYAGDRSVAEIAHELGRTTVAIKVVLFRARRRMLREVR